MRHITQHEHLVRDRLDTHASPASRQEDALATLPRSFEDEARHYIRVIHDNVSKANVDSWRASFSGRLQISAGVVIGRCEKQNPEMEV